MDVRRGAALAVLVLAATFAAARASPPAVDAAARAARLEAWLERRPDDLERRRELMVLLARLRDRAGAEREAREVLRRDPADARARRLLERLDRRVPLRVDWACGGRPAAFAMEATYRTALVHTGAEQPLGASALTGRLLLWDVGPPVDGATPVALAVVDAKARVPRGFFAPPLAHFGLPLAGTAHVRRFAPDGRCTAAYGVEARDEWLFRTPLVLLPDGPVARGEAWSATTTAPSLAFESRRGPVRTTWTWRLAALERRDGAAVAALSGAARHEFLAAPSLESTLAVTDEASARLEVASGRLLELGRSWTLDVRDPSSGDRTVTAWRFKAARERVPWPEAPPLPAACSTHLAARPRTRPTDERARAHLKRSFDWLFYGHADRFTREGLDLEELVVDRNDLGRQVRCAADDCRAFLAGQIVRGLQDLHGQRATASTTPGELDRAVSAAAAAFRLRPEPDALVADDGHRRWRLQEVGGAVRVTEMLSAPPDAGSTSAGR